MHERTLRTLLLVRAIEDTDHDGAVLPLGDREAATRDTLRAARGQEVLRADGTLTPDGRRMLADRAGRLAPGLIARHPVLDKLLASAPTRHWILVLLPIAGIALGLGLSALDESRRINIVAFPLVGLILWNLAVYAVLAIATVRRRQKPREFALAGRIMERWRGRRFARFKAQTGRIHAPLAAALERFGEEWRPAMLPIVAAAGRRVMHLTAACVAIGLIAGMYVRGLVFRYEAGWESTFMGPEGVERLLGLIYGPASAVTGIALPSTAAQIAALEWTAGQSGVNAAPWIHLIAVTAALYVVIPRLVLAGLATFERARRERNAPLPRGLESYARRVLGAAGGHASGIRTTVVPYAYELDGERQAGLQRLLKYALGPASTIAIEPRIAYGDEDDYAAETGARPEPLNGCLVGVMTLAATPESENHGIVLTSWRDRITASSGSARLLFVVDEGPYRERLGNEASMAPRLEERRELWRSFARAAGVPVLFTDLRTAGADPVANADEVAALNAALWPGETR